MSKEEARNLCSYIDASPSAFHAILEAEKLLKAGGAHRLYEGEHWKLEPGALYYLVRDDASIVAFRPGLEDAAKAGFVIAGAHSDFPGLRARIEKKLSGKGYERVAVEAYGGPIHSTWLDRPLSLAGRVVIKNSQGNLEKQLVNFSRPLAVIPNLAIHFNREMNKGVEYPMNSALMPLVSASAADEKEGSWIIRELSEELKLEPDTIISAELGFVESGESILLGRNEELISAPRIDNLEGCHAVIDAFTKSAAAKHGQIAVLFDNEEIGSASARGADSGFLYNIISRIIMATGGKDYDPQAIWMALSRSINISVDGAQGWHPSYADKFDEDYAPLLNRGPAIKANANLRYATDSIGEACFKAACQIAGVPVQPFRMRADLSPGSTIGPISSAWLGVRTVDVGVPMLAMHSIRETAGSLDHGYMIRALREIYRAGCSLA